MNLANLRVLAISALLLLAGWSIGRAQSSSPDFELAVTTTAVGNAMETTLACVRGCNLSWTERGVNPRAKAISQFEFSCKGGNRCSSGTVGGWLAK